MTHSLPMTLLLFVFNLYGWVGGSVDARQRIEAARRRELRKQRRADRETARHKALLDERKRAVDATRSSLWTVNGLNFARDKMTQYRPERALCCLPPESKKRQWFQRVVGFRRPDSDPATTFERFMYFIILTNCVFLALDPGETTSNFGYAYDKLDTAFTIVFSVEFVLKVGAQGFLFAGPDSYLRNWWNVLDFVVLVFGWLKFTSAKANLAALRSFRALRPLKGMTWIPGMETMVSALLSVLPQLRDIASMLPLHAHLIPIMSCYVM
jgi:hypothetical protein